MRAILVVAAMLVMVTAAEAKTLIVQPGGSIRAAIASARPGDRIEVMPGVYREGSPNDLNALTVTIDGIQLIGRPRHGHQVVLENAGTQSYGVWVSPANSAGPGPQANDEKPPCGLDGSAIHGFAIEGFILRGFKLHGLHLACVHDFRITNNIAENNGVYGLFPVVSRRGLMAGNVARGTIRDAGIYVGQSDNVLIIGNRAEDNLIGLEVENSRHCAVIGNEVSNNTLGIFIDVLFDKIKVTQETTVVAFNSAHDNNRLNTGDPADITALLPPGIGILLLGADTTTVTANIVKHNQFAGIAVTSLCLAFALQGQVCPALDVEPNPDGNRILDNLLEANGLLITGNPGLDPLRGDLVWDGSGMGNCWAGNQFATSVPPSLPACK